MGESSKACGETTSRKRRSKRCFQSESRSGALLRQRMVKRRDGRNITTTFSRMGLAETSLARRTTSNCLLWPRSGKSNRPSEFGDEAGGERITTWTGRNLPDYSIEHEVFMALFDSF